MGTLRRFFLTPQPLHALTACRAVFGACLLAAYASRLGAVAELFGPEGVGGRGFRARLPEASPFHPQIAGWLDALATLPSEATVAALYAALLASALAFAVGLWTRPAGVLLLALHLLFYARNPYAFAGWAGYLTGPLLYTVLAPTGRHWGLDAWRRARRGAPAPSWQGPGWPHRLLQIHVCTMYLAAGWSRFDSPLWMDGELLRVVLASAAFSRLAFDWSALAPLLALGTWASLALEALAPVALWTPRLGRWWALGLIAFHAGLELLTHVEYWSFVMCGGLLAFALPWREPTKKG